MKKTEKEKHVCACKDYVCVYGNYQYLSSGNLSNKKKKSQYTKIIISKKKLPRAILSTFIHYIKMENMASESKTS